MLSDWQGVHGIDDAVTVAKKEESHGGLYSCAEADPVLYPFRLTWFHPISRARGNISLVIGSRVRASTCKI